MPCYGLRSLDPSDASIKVQGASALEVSQIARVLNDAGEVGVLIVDTHGQPMLTALEHAGGGSDWVVGRHPSSSNNGNTPIGAAGGVSPKCTYALAHAIRPRGVRWMKPCWRRKGSITSSTASRASAMA